MLRRLRITAHAQRLDDELAAGASPAFSDELAARAQELLSRRLDFARGLQRAAAGGGRSFPVSSAAWLGAKPSLLALAGRPHRLHRPSTMRRGTGEAAPRRSRGTAVSTLRAGRVARRGRGGAPRALTP